MVTFIPEGLQPGVKRVQSKKLRKESSPCCGFVWRRFKKMRSFQNVLFSHMYSHLVFLIAIFLKILKSFSLLSAIRDLKIRGR